MTRSAMELRAGELEQLIAGCLRDDSDAWTRLLGLVRRLAFDLALWKYRFGRDDAEDLAQTVQLRVAQRLPQLRDRSAFQAWVRRLAHHAAVDLIRRRRPVVYLDDLSPEAAASGPLQALDRYETVEMRTDLDRALAGLPVRYREPIALHLLYGMAQEEIGRALGRPRSTVASQIERGLRRLKQGMGAGYASCGA